MSTIDTREHQRFPVLEPTQVETARRFASGPETRFGPGKTLYAIGAEGAPAWLVLEGSIEAVRRDGLSGEMPITTHRVGNSAGSEPVGGSAFDRRKTGGA